MLWVIDTILLVIGLLVVGGSFARRGLRRRYPPPGQIVELGRQRLHLDVRGSDDPVVIFEAGLGDYSASWSLVQPGVAEFAQTVSYDRAGLGWSRGRAGRRTAGRAVDELHELLERAGIAGPYILAGSSYGGLIARLFAHRYPGEVAGLLLVDAAHEDQFARAPEPIRRLAARMARLAGPMYLLPRLLAWLGIHALRPATVPTCIGTPVPEGFDVERYRAVVAAGGTRHLRGTVAELNGLEESQGQLRAARGSLGDVPVIAIAHGRPAPLPASIALADQEENERLWRQLQQEIVASSTDGRVIVAEGSGHAVHLENPRLVVDAVRELVTATRETPVRRRPDPAPKVAPLPAGRRFLGGTARALLRLPGHVVRGVATAALALLVLAAAGMTYETVASARDAAAHPPLGRLIDVGGHRLHLYCTGSGSPTVVIDAGGGDFSLGWRHLQPEVATQTRVCTYDRAGHGWSEAGPMPRSAARIVDELHVLLTAAGEEGPYVLVGASLSAKYVRLYAATYPDEVAGLVIADGRHEGFDDYLGREFMDRAVEMTSTINGIQSTLRHTGVIRLAGTSLLSLLHGPGFQPALGAHAGTYALFATADRQLEAFASELAVWEETNAALAGRDLGDLPVIVLAHGKPLPDSDQERAWQDAQAAQAALSMRGQVVVVEGAGHGIQMDAPEAVAEAIGAVVETVRRGPG